MCGLVGFLGNGVSQGATSEENILQKMADTIFSRGPDDAGYWYDAEQRIGLGHRRLSIVDLSASGHQPMQSASGRYVIAFNGEIYNHLKLRKTLEKTNDAPEWRGHSDTETLLAGFDRWGIQATVENAIGMFAFAVWDKKTCTLTLVRDRLGEKPLYYGWQGNSFIFASELKALRVHPEFKGKINRSVLCSLLRFSYVPAPDSIYSDIFKLSPGALVTVSLKQKEPEKKVFWSGLKTAQSGLENAFTGSPEEAIDQLEILLKDAIQQQMMADVPLGAFLSGGIDSSAIVALMQVQSSRPVKTFSIGFHEEGYNEAEHAKAVAKHLGTDHTELYVTSKQAMDVIPGLPTLYDEPFSDVSQIPTHLVSQLARQHVTVSLSGDAGDELFCGYNRYQMTAKLWHIMSVVPLPLRKLFAKVLSTVSPKSWDSLADKTGRFLPQFARLNNLGDKLHKGARVMTSRSTDELYHGLISHWHDPASVVVDGQEQSSLLSVDTSTIRGLDDVQRMMLLDMLIYLPDDILTKVDRAAMGVSLETRVPFLDHRVVEFAWHLPQSMKLRDGQTKWALRQVLYRHVPKELIERPKMGFAVPIDSWLRGPLREWADSMLSPSRLQNEGFFYPEPVRKKWKEHQSGKRNWQYHLWDVLMFQAWLESERR